MKAGTMHLIDRIAVVLFFAWLFGFIHIILAVIIIAVLYGISNRKRIYAVIGSTNTATIRKQHNTQPKPRSMDTVVPLKEKGEE
jgi:hypothetical protein